MEATFQTISLAQTAEHRNRQGISQNVLLCSLETQSPPPYESHLDNDVPRPRYPDSRLAQLPETIILRISAMLGVVPQHCLKYTNRYFMNLIKTGDTRALRCLKWRVLSLLEVDLLARGQPLPDRLSCVFCKCTHPKEDFGVPGKNAGYGFEHIRILERCNPTMRYCWRHIPKRLHYISNDETSGLSSSESTLASIERWVSVWRRACVHCGTRLGHENKGKSVCLVCPTKCPICGSAELVEFERHGPRRPLESYTKIRFVRRWCTGFALELRDLNGISNPTMAMSAQMRTWSDKWPILERLDHLRLSRFLLKESERRFPLYSVVEFEKLQPGTPCTRIKPGGFFHPCKLVGSITHNTRTIQKSTSDIKRSHTNKAVERPTS